MSLESQFSNNLFLLQNIAKCEVQMSQSDKAKITFERVC